MLFQVCCFRILSEMSGMFCPGGVRWIGGVPVGFGVGEVSWDSVRRVDSAGAGLAGVWPL